MVLSFFKNNPASNTTSEIFIHTNDDCSPSDFTLTVLLAEEALSTQISRNSQFVKTWSQRLKLTPEDYLQQLLLALQERCKHTGTQNGSVKNEDGANVEHVFQVEKSTLNWKQYFPDKQIYGKRGAVPLQEANYSSTVWKLLQESVLKHVEAQDQINDLKKANADLKQEVDEALSRADESLRAKEKFQQQNYAKFCALINSKKEKIRQLEGALRNAPGPSSAQDLNASDAASSSAPPVAAKKKQPKTTVTSRGDPTLKLCSRNSDEEYDEDTDVDDVSKCDTDEENEIRSRRHRMSTAQGKTPKTSESKCPAASGSKRAAPDESSQSCKKTSHGDSEDDLFNSSVEHASLALLSSIKPRATTGGKVSDASSTHSFANLNMYGGSPMNLVHAGHNSQVFSVARPSAQQENISAEDDPGSVVARVLRKNAEIRKTKGIDMPRRVDDFDIHFNDRSNASIHYQKLALNCNPKMSWALEVANEKSARSFFLGDAGHCDFSPNANNLSPGLDIDAPVPVEIGQYDCISRREFGEELTADEPHRLSKVSPASRNFSPPSSDNVQQGDSGRIGGDHEFNGQCGEISSENNLIPKYEADTQFSLVCDPDSDDSVVVLDDSETKVPSKFDCKFVPDKSAEGKRRPEETNQSAMSIRTPKSNPSINTTKLSKNPMGIAKGKQMSQLDSEACGRSSKRCGELSRTSRKKARVLELDLSEHDFRSGSVIEEILM